MHEKDNYLKTAELSTLTMLLEGFNALRNNLYCINVQTAVRFVKNCQLRTQHQKLQNFCLLLFAAAEAGVQVTLGIFAVHLQMPFFPPS